MKIRYVRNSMVNSLLMGIPYRHKHIRMALSIDGLGILIFNEAVIAAIVRAYINIKTSPKKTAIYMTRKDGEWKEGFAKYQLIEEEVDEETLRRKLKDMLNEVDSEN